MEFHSSFAIGQVKRRCIISSGPVAQIGHFAEVPMCPFARIHFIGRIPCRARQVIFLILLGILNLHNIFQTGLRADDPSRAN
jgi:hypothetical protein